ncbi:ubiquitin carboxyl-terminal hydrolase 25-like [Actinia tenebrosa]|uniref:Ubiquitin carboxyl-terminal hydrolase 25-like n=1 Tax=Actinia tenebrosa TaxID=6105 RepID=A0A6P8IPM9_ACTTE|nr:ubiquitin carboxyl-terminal hydrolase 25-like [Actinia tenebrosa]
MAHSKNYQPGTESHDSRTAVLQDKDKPMDCSDQVTTEDNQVIQQLCEVTGAAYDQAFNAFIAANGNVENALTFLTNPEHITDGTSQKGMQTSVVKNCQTSKDDVIDLTKDKDERDEDLEKAIALSLQESHSSAPQGITAEEQDISRVLEASLIENKPGLKRKRGDPWMTFVDPVNPHERKRSDGTPVGFKNVGNTCWFSAVIQSLFHLPVFRKLVLHCTLPDINQNNSKETHRISFMQELRKLFALLIGSKRKYVDPTKAVEILKEALQYNGSESNPGNQQDVSEFTHKLLEWLEDTFKVETCAASSKQEKSSNNPVMELFFGQSKVEGVYEGKNFSNLEMFGAYPVQVQGYNNLHDSLEGGMARGEIEPANNEQTHKSDQEHWFTRLPAVLKFMLSRFLFNQNTSRAEKIHERFCFDTTIYMDRYLEKNKDITRIRREEVKKLKERHQLLRNSLDSYTNYGTGARHSHIQDILDSSLQFVQSTDPINDSTCCDVEMKPVIPEPPRSHGMTSLRPAPRYISLSERQSIEACLKRWRTEVEQDVQVISKSLKEVEESISVMYDDEEMKKVPYRLHAVLVHEGQASGGHYWAYIYNPTDKQWRKFNDITVSQVTWEEVERESLGGYRHVSAYGLMYVDGSREDQVLATETPDHLPQYLQRLVDEDNINFEKELVEWDEKQAAAAAAAKASSDDKSKVAATVSSRPDLVLDAEASCAVSPHDHTPITHLSSLQDIDNLLDKMCSNEKLRLEKIADEHPPDGLRDLRLEYIGHYLILCGAPQYVVEWTILKQIVDDTKSRDDSCLRIKRRAIELLNKPDPEKLEELNKWKEKYQVFERVNSCFLTGLEHLHNNKYKEALPYLVHAYTLNHKLQDAAHPSQSMDEALLAFCRRQCFLELNEHAIALFEAQDKTTLCDGLDLVSELVVPCIPSLITSPHAEDREAVEQIRNRWFTYLGSSMLDEKRREKLQDFLPKLLDVTSEGHQEIRPPPVLRPTSSRDLCERFTKAMELVHANMAFSAKA